MGCSCKTRNRKGRASMSWEDCGPEKTITLGRRAQAHTVRTVVRATRQPFLLVTRPPFQPAPPKVPRFSGDTKPSNSGLRDWHGKGHGPDLAPLDQSSCIIIGRES